MRRILSTAAMTLAFAVGLSGLAQAANEYTVNFSTNPTKSGTSKKPRAISGKFGFSVRDTEGLRPLALDALRVDFTGVRINTSVRGFRRCTATQIERAQSDRGCPSAALMATGFANNIAGAVNNRADASIRCALTIRLYNSGPGKMALFVRGGPNEARPCPIAVATAIPVSISKRASGDRLSFSIPQNLKNPLPTLRNSLVETQLTMRRRTVRNRGKRVGFFETTGRCVRNRRPANVFFDNEGATGDIRQAAVARCSR